MRYLFLCSLLYSCTPAAIPSKEIKAGECVRTEWGWMDGVMICSNDEVTCYITTTGISCLKRYR